MPKAMPPKSELAAAFVYDPLTGLFTWRCSGLPALATNNGNGYKCGQLKGRKLYAHRVAWKMTYDADPEHIDHNNGDRSDNRVSNLSSGSVADNSKNTKRHRSNRSGVMGVHWYKAYKMWQVYIGDVNRKNIGYFRCFGAAVKARKAAERDNAYHPNHGRSSPQRLHRASDRWR